MDVIFLNEEYMCTRCHCCSLLYDLGRHLRYLYATCYPISHPVAATLNILCKNDLAYFTEIVMCLVCIPILDILAVEMHRQTIYKYVCT